MHFGEFSAQGKASKEKASLSFLFPSWILCNFARSSFLLLQHPSSFYHGYGSIPVPVWVCKSARLSQGISLHYSAILASGRDPSSSIFQPKCPFFFVLRSFSHRTGFGRVWGLLLFLLLRSPFETLFSNFILCSTYDFISSRVYSTLYFSFSVTVVVRNSH